MNGLQEEEDGEDWEWEYYYEEGELEEETELDIEEEELNRLSPTPTTAPTTRATSPFPDQQQAFRKLLKFGEQCTEPPMPLETTTGKYIGLPSYARAFESFHDDPDWYNPVKELSVALAAQYLGQSSEEVVKSLPVEFPYGDKSERGSSSGNRSTRRKKKGSENEDGADTASRESEEKKHKKKKRKKKGDGKFLPKITVRDLVNMLEPQLFKNDDTGTMMVMKEDTAKSSIARQKREKVREAREPPKKLESCPPPPPPPPSAPPNPLKTEAPANVAPETGEEPIKKEVVIIHDPKNPHQVEVCMDGQSTFVTMRPHSRRSTGAKSKDSKKGRKSSSGICKDKNNQSPSDSEAYGTGSSVSEALDQPHCPHSGEDPSREDQPSRHSRLLKILQESEESDCFPSSSTPSDHESLSSLPQTGGVAVERKLSFRSIKSSGRESDADSISSELKASPPIIRKPQSASYANPASANQKLMNLSLQSCYAMDTLTPTSSEISSPSSPGGYLDYSQLGSLERRKRMSAPATPSGLTRGNWGDSFDYNDPGREVEEILKRKVSSSNMASPLARTLQESRLMGATSPLTLDRPRNSPAAVRTQSPSYRHSPKLEQELLELGNLPPPQYPTPPSTLPRTLPIRGCYHQPPP